MRELPHGPGEGRRRAPPAAPADAGGLGCSSCGGPVPWLFQAGVAVESGWPLAAPARPAFRARPEVVARGAG